MQRDAVRQRYFETGETIEQLTLAFFNINASHAAITIALKITPDARELRRILVGLNVPKDQIRAIAEKCVAKPNVMANLYEAWRHLDNPVLSFLEECTHRAANVEVLKTELLEAWERWAADRGLPLIDPARFYQRLENHAPHAISVSYEQDGHRLSVFRGIRLKPA